jgi:hypothetical protein
LEASSGGKRYFASERLFSPSAHGWHDFRMIAMGRIQRKERPMDQDAQAYERAKRRVDMLKGFYIHFAVYVCVIAMLAVIDVADDSSGWWFYWPMLGWGIAVAIHAAVVFLGGGRFSSDWEERKIREYMEKDRG